MLVLNSSDFFLLIYIDFIWVGQSVALSLASDESKTRKQHKTRHYYEFYLALAFGFF